jgi:hypothetical protein
MAALAAPWGISETGVTPFSTALTPQILSGPKIPRVHWSNCSSSCHGVEAGMSRRRSGLEALGASLPFHARKPLITVPNPPAARTRHNSGPFGTRRPCPPASWMAIGRPQKIGGPTREPPISSVLRDGAVTCRCSRNWCGRWTAPSAPGHYAG